jgi:membrane-bound ClpP family serine protease
MNRSLAVAIVVGLVIGLVAIFSQKYPNNYNARAVIASLGLVFVVAALVSIAGIALTLIGIVLIAAGSFWLFGRLFR